MKQILSVKEKVKMKKLKEDAPYLSMKDRYYLANVDRIGYLDIECTNLKANFGFMLSWVLMVRDTQAGGKHGKIIAVEHAVITKAEIYNSNEKEFEDKRILEKLLFCIKKYKIKLLIGHFFHGAHRMDIPFIRTRCITNKINGFPHYQQIWFGDTHRMAKNGYSLHSNRLDVVGDMCGVSTKKTPVSSRKWQLAQRGDKDALAYVLHHNKNDVKINYKIHLKMEQFCAIPRGLV